MDITEFMTNATNLIKHFCHIKKGSPSCRSKRLSSVGTQNYILLNFTKPFWLPLISTVLTEMS